jgi:hypothetical protein
MLRGGAESSQEMSQLSDFPGQDFPVDGAMHSMPAPPDDGEFDAEPTAEWIEEIVSGALQDERLKGMSRAELEDAARAFWKQSMVDEAQLTQVGQTWVCSVM